MISTQTIGGFACEIRGLEGSEHFRAGLVEVVRSFPRDELRAVRQWLAKIVFGPRVVSDELLLAIDRVGHPNELGWCSRQLRYVFIAAEGCQGLEDAASLVAHELRHAFQFATGMDEAEVDPAIINRFQYMSLEDDANSFAASLGFPRPSDKLRRRGLPTDREFQNLAECWHALTEDQRLAFLRRAKDIWRSAEV